MTTDEFLTWAKTQEGRYELQGGRVVAMSPERSRHNLAKAAIWRALEGGIEEAGLTCQTYTDGMTVRIDDTTAYEPDAQVRCGPELPEDAIEVPDPVIVVEVTSPSTRSIDTSSKLVGYFAVPSVMHYLVIDLDSGAVIHHARDALDGVHTTILRDGILRLDPPGFDLVIPTRFWAQ
jgi:Uma2 family endonuclease